VTLAVLAAALVALAPSPSPPPPQPFPASAAPAPLTSTPPTAGALYDAAFERWRALPLPPFATYLTHGVATRKGRVQEWKDDVWYRESDGRCTIVGVALDARDRPDPPDFESRCLSPGYAFSFIPQRHGIGGSALPLEVATAEPSAAAAAPKTIGAITVRSRPYAVAFAGNDTLDGTPVVHLALRPYRDPDKHILRDLWIDPATDGVVRLRGEATASAHLVRIVFDAYYDESQTEQTLRRITGYGKAQLFLIKVGADFTYALTGFTYPDSLPDWYFDRKAYFAHGGIPTKP
jgi:hypothetical protein